MELLFDVIIECQYENQEHYLFNYCPIIGLYFGAIIQKIRISTEMSNFSSIEIIILIHKICILSKIKIPSIQLFEKNVIICSIYQYKFGYICLVIICLDMSCLLYSVLYNWFASKVNPNQFQWFSLIGHMI